MGTPSCTPKPEPNKSMGLASWIGLFGVLDNELNQTSLPNKKPQPFPLNPATSQRRSGRSLEQAASAKDETFKTGSCCTLPWHRSAACARRTCFSLNWHANKRDY